MNKHPLTSYGHWQYVKALGSGAFGEVHQWKNVITGEEIATKRLKANPKLKPDEINILHKRWLIEYKWMQNLQINFIVGAVKIDDSDFLNYLAEQTNVELPVIIMEYCNGGDLRGHLNKFVNLNGLIEFEVRKILYAVLRATEYLHENCNIEHRDIKPENIVLHISGNEKSYKLTDFGYAREIPESTVAQSVVGTRNYVAPEVIDPGIYTKTVDYWSVGILCYEIICGTHPFLPHQNFVNRMRSIQKKPSKCIAIVQKIDDLTEDNVEFCNQILPPNHLSPFFKENIEKWLQLALDANYKTRGCNNQNELKFYSDLDAILPKKIVTVFSLKTCQKYFYDIESYENLPKFYEDICFDNRLDIMNIFFILPLLHPKKRIERPVDYFVPEWCDTNNAENPPVMLFVTEYLIQQKCDLDVEKHFNASETIKKCMGISSDENIPLWLLEQFEKDVHFMLTKEQNILQCYLLGLESFIIEIEHEVVKYNYSLDVLNNKIAELSGIVKHSNILLNEYVNIKKDEASTELEKSKQFYTESQEIERAFAIQIKVAYNELVQKCRQLTTNEIFRQYTKKDIFEILSYQKFLSLKHSHAQRIERTQISFEKCITEFIKFINCSELCKIRAEVHEHIEKFTNLRQRIYYVYIEVDQLERKLEDFTRSLVTHIRNDTLSSSMMSMQIDGPRSHATGLRNDTMSLTTMSKHANELVSNISVNNHSLNELNDDTMLMINECETLCEFMTSFMDTD